MSTSEHISSGTRASAPDREGLHGRRRRRLSPFGGLDAGVLLLQCVVAVAIVATWQLSATLGLIPSLLHATPAEVWHAARAASADGTLWPSVLSTLEATLWGFLLGSTVGITVGIGLALLPRVERIFRPYLHALNSMPRVALGPILIVIFGIGQGAKVALAFTLVVFILMVNAAAGIQAADRDVLELMRAHGATKRQLFTKVLFPVALPTIFAGLRLGLIYSLLGVITAEIISSKVGLGGLITLYSQTFNIAGVYAILIMLAIISGLLNVFMNLLERRLFRWKPTE